MVFVRTGDSQAYPSFSGSLLGAGSGVRYGDVNPQGAALAPTQKAGLLGTVAGIIGLAPLDLVDTAASSIPGIKQLTGLQRGELSDKVLGIMDMPGLNRFYDDNRSSIEVASGIAGLIASDVVASKLLKPAGKTMEFLRGKPILGRVANLDANYRASLLTLRSVDTSLAKRGAMNVEMYLGEARAKQFMVDPTTGKMSSVFSDVSRQAARGQVARSAFARGATRGAVTEGIYATIGNTNSLFFNQDEDSFATNLGNATVGILTGGALDAFMTRYAIKSFFNKDRYRRALLEGTDPVGVEGSRLRAAELQKLYKTQQPEFIGLGYRPVSDNVTSLATQSRTLDNPALSTGSTPIETQRLMENRSKLATQTLEQALEESLKITNKGIGVGGTSFGLKSQGYWEHYREMLYRDPGTMYGVRFIGGVGEDQSAWGLHQTRQTMIDTELGEVQKILQDGGRTVPLSSKERASAERAGINKETKFVKLTDEDRAKLVARQRELIDINSDTAQVSINGEWMPIETARIFDNWKEPEIRFNGTGQKGKGTWEVTEGRPGFNLGIGDDLELYFPGGKNLDTADDFDVLRMYRASKHAIDSFERTGNVMVVPQNANWFQLDMAEELIKRTGNESSVKFVGRMDRFAAQQESLAQKVDYVRGLKDASNDVEFLHRLRVRLNLPKLSSFEAGQMGMDDTPVDWLVRGAPDGDYVRRMTYPELVKGLNDVRKLNGLVENTGDEIESLSGNSFRFLLSEDGTQTLKPLIAYRSAFAPTDWAQDYLGERMFVNRMDKTLKLTSPEAPTLNRSLVGSILSNPNYAIATEVGGLSDASLTSMLPGARNVAPGTTIGGWINSVTSREWAQRDNPILLAAANLRQSINNQVRAHADQVIRANMGETLNVVGSPRNASTKLLLNQHDSFRPGWDVVSQGAGKTHLAKWEPRDLNGRQGWAIPLQKTEKNATRFRQLFGREMADGQTLLNPTTGKEVIVDDLGRDAIERRSAVFLDKLQNQNNLLKSQGLNEIEIIANYAPPPNTQGKYIGFTFDVNNNVIPNGTIVASTPEQYERMVEAAYKSGFMKPGYVVRSRDEVTNFMDLWDKAQSEMLHPGTTAVAPNKTNRGLLSGNTINMAAWDESAKEMLDGYLRHADDLSSVMFSDQIKAAQSRARVAAPQKQNAVNQKNENKVRTVYDYYVQNITGRMGISDTASPIGKGYNYIEGQINGWLRQAAPGVTEQADKAGKLWKAMDSWLSRMNPFTNSAGRKSDFDALVSHLGPHMPFRNAAEYLESNVATKLPPELAKITGDLNKFEATWMLRMFEVLHPLLNLSGMVNAMPSVIRAMQKLPHETDAMWRQRVGVYGLNINSRAGNGIAVPDMAKIAWRGMKRAWSEGSSLDPAKIADYQYRKSMGYVTQEVAEFQRQFGSIQTKNQLMRFLSGNPAAKESDSLYERKGLVGWISVLSDKSEDFSRAWGHYAGLELADLIGLTGRESREAFAHEIANKMIANYDPMNRPEIFQGAVGSVFGLFQSFTWNFYQRLFRYIETGDKRSLATQLAMQSSLFGVTGMPGWKAANDWLFNNSNEDEDPISGIYSRFGDQVGDLVMAGTISNLPKLFGADGINVYSRGDINPRAPVANAPPVVSTANTMFQALGDMADLFSSANPGLTQTQLAEVVSNLIPNRPLAGMIDVGLLDGREIDRAGQVVTESKSTMENVYRAIGARSLRQSKELEAFYANKNAQEEQYARQTTLRRATRAAIREGNYDLIPDIFNTYVANGGDPKHYRRWIREQYEAASETRGERQLDKALKSSTKLNDVERLLDMGVSITDSETYDPTELMENQQQKARWETGVPSPTGYFGTEDDGTGPGGM